MFINKPKTKLNVFYSLVRASHRYCEVTGSNPVEVPNFFFFRFLTRLYKLRSQLRGTFFIWFHFRSSYIWFIHINSSHWSLSREHMNTRTSFGQQKHRNGLSCTIYKIPVNFSLSLDLEPGTSNPNKWINKLTNFSGIFQTGMNRSIEFSPEFPGFPYKW